MIVSLICGPLRTLENSKTSCIVILFALSAEDDTLKVTSLVVFELETGKSLLTFLFSLIWWFKRDIDILWTPELICLLSSKGLDKTLPAAPPSPILTSVTGLLSR